VHGDAKHWKAKADRANARIDVLHETLAAQMNEIEMLQAEAEERLHSYATLSENADAIAREVITVTESRRPLADALAKLHDAVSEHMQVRNPGVTETSTGVVFITDDEADAALYRAQADVQTMLKEVEGLRWQKLS